jgi:hypothetical protein
MGESKAPTSKDLLNLANHFGLKTGKEIIEQVRECASKWKSYANEANISANTINMIEKRIQLFK